VLQKEGQMHNGFSAWYQREGYKAGRSVHDAMEATWNEAIRQSASLVEEFDGDDWQPKRYAKAVGTLHTANVSDAGREKGLPS
jgi:hypothetical protein